MEMILKVITVKPTNQNSFKNEKYFTNREYFHLYINEGQIQTSLYDKRNSNNFKVVRFPFKH